MTQPAASIQNGIGEPELVVLPDPDAVADVAAERIATALSAAIAARGVAHWATTGGSTPGPIYRRLAKSPLRDRVPWDRVHVWWGDDRWVPPQDARSNAAAFRHLFLRDVSLPTGQVHVMPIGEALEDRAGPAAAANQYEQALRAAGLDLDVAGFPRLDVVLVGIGSDGHLLSVFPGSRTWDDPAWVQAVPSPTHIEPHVERVTLHPQFVASARLAIAVVHGAAKAAVLGRVFGPRADVRELPAQLARRAGATWVVDEAAAAEIPAAQRGVSAG